MGKKSVSKAGKKSVPKAQKNPGSISKKSSPSPSKKVTGKKSPAKIVKHIEVYANQKDFFKMDDAYKGL